MLTKFKLYEEFTVNGGKIAFTDDELKMLYDACDKYGFDYDRYGDGYFNGFFRVAKNNKLIVLSSQDSNTSDICVFDTDNHGTELYRKTISSIDEFIKFLRGDEKSKIEKSDVDPYGEEEWNDDLSFDYMKFEKYSINERFGFPDSLEPVVKILTDYMIEKMNWWTYRKGMANYTEDHHFDMRDFDPSIINNKNFPLAHINLKFSIIIGKPPKTPRTSIAGFAFPFKGKNDTDVDYQTTRMYRGKINMFLEFKANIVGKSIQIGKLREEAHTVIRHELQHVYEDYQKMRHGVDMMRDNAVPNFNWALMFDLFDKYPKCVKFRRFLYLFYSISHEKEFNAFMSEFSSGKVKTIGEITAGNRAMDILKYDSFDKIYNEILAEFKRYYPDADLESIPKFVIGNTTTGIKGLKVEIPRWLIEYDKDFKGFLYRIWKRIQLKKEKFIKKSSKIFYSKKLLEFSEFQDTRNEIDPYGEEDWDRDEIVAKEMAEEEERLRIAHEEQERRLNELRDFIREIWWEFRRESLERRIIKNNYLVTRIEGVGGYSDTFTYTHDGKEVIIRKTWGPMMKEGYGTWFGEIGNGVYQGEFPMEEENHLYLFFRNKWEENYPYC